MWEISSLKTIMWCKPLLQTHLFFVPKAMWLHYCWTGWYERHRLFKVCRCCLRQWHSVGRESKKRWTRRRGEGKWDDSVKVISVNWLRRRSEGGPIPAAVHSQLKLSVYIHACSPVSVPPGRTVCPPPTGSVLAHKLMVASRMERWLEPSLNKVYIDVFKVYILLTFLTVLDEQDKTATSCHLTSLVWVKQAFCTGHSNIKRTEILLWLSNMTSVWARCTLKS